jgi:hypothetical protein
MALAEYWLCDRCGEKTFYDARLNWCDSLESRLVLRRDGRMLPYGAGDMAAICKECSKTHEIIVRPR